MRPHACQYLYCAGRAADRVSGSSLRPGLLKQVGSRGAQPHGGRALVRVSQRRRDMLGAAQRCGGDA